MKQRSTLPPRLSLPFAHAAALTDFEKQNNKRLEEFSRRLRHNPVPRKLYHYTNADGLRGILDSGQFWLTESHAVNDPSEVLHGLDIALQELKALPGYREDEVLQRFGSGLEILGRKGVTEGVDHFIFSLSRHENDLNQWRLYADNARGFALEFDISKVEQSFAHSSSENASFAIQYDDALLAEVQRPLIRMLPSLLAHAFALRNDEKAFHCYIDELRVATVVPLLGASLIFKHAAYSSEREYRLMTASRRLANDPRTFTRTRGDKAVRYRVLNWREYDPNALTRIMIGPAADKTVARQFAEECLRNTGSRTAIEESNLPYRV